MKTKNIIAIIFLLLFASPSLAAVYYVNCTSGDDTTGNGSSGTPWKTMMKAESSASNSDTVHVAGGTCVEDDATVHCLAAAKAITWIADVPTTIQGHASGTCVIRANTAQNVSFSGFTIDGDGKTNPVYKQGAGRYTFNGCTVTGTASGEVFNMLGGTLTFSNGTINLTSSGGGLFYLQGATSATITGNTITTTLTNQEILFLGSAGTSEFSNNTVTMSGTSPRLVWNGGTVATVVTISGNTATSTVNSNNLVKLFSSSGVDQTVTVTNNTFTLLGATQTSAPISVSNGSTVTVTGNTIDLTASTATTGAEAISVVSVGSAMAVNVSNNTINAGNTGTHGIAVGTETSGAGDNTITATISGNIMRGLLYYTPAYAGAGTWHAIFFGHNTAGTITNNQVYGSAGYCIVAKGSGGEWSGTGAISTNLCYNSNVKSEGIFIKGLLNVPVYNNTVYIDSSFNAADNSFRVGPNGAFNSTGSLFKNNIAVGRDATPIVLIETSSSATFDYNLTWNHAGSGMDYTVGATTYVSFAEWQAAGYDTHGVSANPLFKSTTDLHLNSGSPAKKAGTDVGITLDLSGKAYKVPPSMGVYEVLGSIFNVTVGDNKSHPVSINPFPNAYYEDAFIKINK